MPSNSLTTETLTITAPDDWHIHLRDGEALRYTVGDAARSFQRAIIMPNLAPPVMNAKDAMAYKARILEHVPADTSFDPLMVLYLTDNTTSEIINEAHKAGVTACKLYPAGATTNSDSGVTSFSHITGALETMQKLQMPLLIHGEVTDKDVDIFDREAVFIEQKLIPLVKQFPELNIVFEHITTRNATEFVNEQGSNIAATITAHHLLFNRNHMLAAGIRPHFYCLPILKRNEHQKALIKAATSGNPKYFLGTDSAPHSKNKKENACGCAGSYTAFAAVELYAQAFEAEHALDKLEGFASHFGPDFYNLKRNSTSITLEKFPWVIPDTLPFNEDVIVPLMAGETLQWKVQR